MTYRYGNNACGRSDLAPTLRCAFSSALVLLSTLMLVGSGVCQSVSIVNSFTGVGSNSTPYYVTPTQGRNGLLYGTTVGSGNSDGAVFQIATSGSLKFPYAFNAANGSAPYSGLTLGSDGNFYGVESDGGTENFGVLYRISPAGGYSVVHSFLGGTDGAYPFYIPIQGSDGNIYGVSESSSTATATVYKYTPSSSAFESIYLFNQASSEAPTSIIEGSNGNLYGTVSGGICGEIFEITTGGSLVWSYNFTCPLRGAAKGGSQPVQIIEAVDGNLYGATLHGGTPQDYGVIFKLDGQTNEVSVLYVFPGNGQSGALPNGLVQATDGNLYGSTKAGGKYQQGALFKISTAGEINLLTYFNGTLGSYPLAPPSQATDGSIYGTTEAGGRFNAGEVYKLDFGAVPFVAFVQPGATVGQSAQILGQGLTGTTAVTFNGVPATSFKVVSDTFLTAAVPAGATTGPVVVTTPTGPLTSNANFRVIQ